MAQNYWNKVIVTMVDIVEIAGFGKYQGALPVAVVEETAAIDLLQIN